MPLDARTSLRHTGNRRLDAKRIASRNNRARFPIQWPKYQSFDGNGLQVDTKAVAAQHDIPATSWFLEGFSGLTIQLLVNGLSRGTIPNDPLLPLDGGAISAGDTVQIRKLDAPDGSGIFVVKGFDGQNQPIAFGKYEAI